MTSFREICLNGGGSYYSNVSFLLSMTNHEASRDFPLGNSEL